MPIKRSLAGKPKEDDSTLIKLLRAVETVGLNPGDMMGGLGTAATRAGKLLRFPGEATESIATNVGDKMLRNHDLAPAIQNEFHLMDKIPTKPDLPHEEIRKMLDLLDPRPRK